MSALGIQNRTERLDSFKKEKKYVFFRLCSQLCKKPVGNPPNYTAVNTAENSRRKPFCTSDTEEIQMILEGSNPVHIIQGCERPKQQQKSCWAKQQQRSIYGWGAGEELASAEGLPRDSSEQSSQPAR